MRMHDPPHPGEVIRELCPKPLRLGVTEAARGLRVSRKALSELLNGHSGISPDMAIRLSKAFGGGPESRLPEAGEGIWESFVGGNSLAKPPTRFLAPDTFWATQADHRSLPATAA